MLTLKELESWFEDIKYIVIDLFISVNNAKRLTEDRYEYEESIKRHGFLRHHWYQIRFIMVIQLAKLFTDNKDSQKRNFYKLCNCLEHEKYGKDIADQLVKNSKASFAKVFKSKEDILEAVAETRSDLASHEELIKKLVSARNQLYAHTDPKPQIPSINLSELEILTESSGLIFNRLRGQLFNINTDFKSTPTWDIDYIIKGLSENLKSKLEFRE